MIATQKMLIQLPKVCNCDVMRVNVLVDRQIASISMDQPPEPSDDYGGPAEDSPSLVEDSTLPPETIIPEHRVSASFVRSKKGKRKKKKKIYS